MPRAGLSTERVVLAAADLADEVGFEAVSVSALARGFGVKDASLYSHVKNLQDLRERVALKASEEFADRIAAAVAGRAGRDALAAFAGAYRDFAVHHPGRYAASQMPLEPAVLERSSGPRRLIEATAAVLRAYALPEPDQTDAVRLLRSFFHGFADLEASGAFHHPRGLDDSWARIVDSLHFLLEKWPQRAD
ncbi:WHG domain-containing protein [Hamadaea sp. NPDC050747]|uniref:TetR/AcrR family transcriptional regulator n=1 Tax=Hamadaea sp. NPDC050747 TaxID=3155789 RepID=UPI0033EA74B2